MAEGMQGAENPGCQWLRELVAEAMQGAENQGC